MRKTLENIIKNYIDNSNLVNRIIITVFVNTNNLHHIKNKLINNLILPKEHPIFFEILGFDTELDFDELIEAFEVAIPSQERQTNGAVYTPSRIKEYIVEKVLNESSVPNEELVTADISCGCGAFLFSLAQHIQKQTNQTFSYIFRNQIFGLDINKNGIERAKILLSLLAIKNGEDADQFNFNLFIGNALDFDWKQIKVIEENKGFDIVVGNPPYVRAKNLDITSKELLKNWQVTKTGNPDLYIPFFEIGIKNLNQTGLLGYITVNSFFKSVNARSLRSYVTKHNLSFEVVNFGHEQVFNNRLTYTCLCFVSKTISNSLRYVKTNSYELNKLKHKHYDLIRYDTLDNHRGWLLNNPKSLSNIKKIENIGTPLGELLPIKNGIATLNNSIYIFKPLEESDKYYHFEKSGAVYTVEKAICRDIIKPNILKFEHEIPEIQEKIIYPYTNGITLLSLLDEKNFYSDFPKAYQYLELYKKELAKRDKGNGNYRAWYAFGRTQALLDKGLKLLFPYMSKHPHFVFTDNVEMLIYCGYAIFSDSAEQLLILKKILESSVFNYYMQNTSKPYTSGYFSYAKNYVKHFGVCDLHKEEETELLNLLSKKEINAFVEDKYRILF